MNVLALTACLTGAASLAMEFGFYAPPLPAKFLHACQMGAAAVLLLYGLARLLRPGLWAGARARRVHPAAALVVGFLAAALLGAVALKLPRAVPRVSAENIGWIDALFTSTTAVCVTGMPVRAIGSDQRAGTPAHLRDKDLPVAGFSRLGQCVILVLMQLGGLAIMLAGTILAVRLGRTITGQDGDEPSGPPTPQRGSGLAPVAQPSSPAVGPSRAGELARIVRFVLIVTFAVEGLGAALLYTMWAPFDWPAADKWFNAVFTSVSAFCNCGYTLTGDSMVRYHRYWQVHGVIGPLIVVGGLGFPVLLNLHEWATGGVRRLARRPPNGPRPARISLHSRIVLASSTVLILGGAVGLLAFETFGQPPRQGTRVEHLQPTESDRQLRAEMLRRDDPHLLRDEPVGQALADSFFLSVASRTSGFFSAQIGSGKAALSQGSQLWLALLMLIGGSPGSAAGGIKTVALAVLLAAAASAIKRRGGAQAFGRTLGVEIVAKAVTLAACYAGLVAAVTLLLTITEAGTQASVMELLFESASGCGTAGLSLGLTDKLSRAGRVVLMFGVLAGRLGPLVLLIALSRPVRPIPRQPLPENVALG